ncbi:MAG TPA: uroporphyrinogen decarboxylase family protein [Armatimonadota bacterium]|nr:uroporphyrinogen decarboxylase family protein [Armatimonadota bacterium]
MQPKWHIAFCNVTYTGYAGVSYADYYGSPAVMLEAQLAAREHAEKRFGVGRFMRPSVDSPSCTFASYLGMPVVVPSADELPYVDTRRPLVSDPSDLSAIRIGDPRSEGLMARRWETWQYYRERGYEVGFGGASTAVVTLACQVSGDAVLRWFAEDPEGARALLDRLMDAMEHVASFDAELRGAQFRGFTYTGDDNSGLLSPAMYREFAVPCYRRLYADNEGRFMHSELLRAQHLRIARDELGITSFHGAGCVNLTLAEMHEIMGHGFWTQLIPQEMLELSPAGIDERVRDLAGSGCSHVQLYPGRDTPEANMEAAIEACRRECPGGPAW